MMMSEVSIIIPAWNEEKNISLLVSAIHKALSKKSISYEVIVVDDHSIANTHAIVRKLRKQYPVRLYVKKGEKGKGRSLIEGFSHAKYDIVCMIDADLQYSPTYIPVMVKKITEGWDVVIANRKIYKAPFFRRCASVLFATVFARLLHGFTLDVQSGLKVFRKTVITRILLHPSRWAFDLEFLVKAQSAGYSITGIDIAFERRRNGKSRINLVKASFEMAYSALALRFAHVLTVPFHTSMEKKKGRGFHFKGMEFINYTDLPMRESAFRSLTFYQRAFLLFLAGVLLAGLLISWHTTLVVLISLLTILYFIDLAFNFFLVYRSYFREPEIEVKQKALEAINEYDWPSYTILCPLYKESAVLSQFINAISKLSYPKHKLQVLLLLENDDKETQKKIDGLDLPYYFDVVMVPHSFPKTKPKALNYGLSLATGEYSVIYDAEDVPDPMQLKKAVLSFKKAKSDVICVQAKLNFYNPNQNILTRLFTIEYSLWFDLVLTGLQSIHAPIPLGGTSNHFRTADLMMLSRWDPFNVTEDADLGMRIVKRGYKTAIINSYTMEEANSDFANWFRQRSRWIKGYIQTYFVHTRRPKEFISDWRKPHFITFQLIIGAKVLSMIINPVMWAMTIAYFAARPYTGAFIQSLYVPPIFYMAAFCLVIGNFLYMYYYMLGAAKRNQWDLIPFALLTPVYWLGMSVAAFYAVWEFIARPHYWHKTRHGFHLKTDKKIRTAVLPKTRPQIAVTAG